MIAACIYVVNKRGYNGVEGKKVGKQNREEEEGSEEGKCLNYYPVYA